MSVRRTFNATPDEVFAVLLDAYAFRDWVVGTRKIRAVDEHWPTVGARFHHSVGVWPMHVNDSTVLLEVDPPRRLVLEARARPHGTARVTIDVRPVAEGTEVTLDEEPTGGIARLIWNPALAALRNMRNVESLRRLHKVVERRARGQRAAG